MQYICYVWQYGSTNRAFLSWYEETFSMFKERIVSHFPASEGWHHRFSEFKEMY